MRRWQREALAQFEAAPCANFLAVATPGAGKTTFALTALRRALLARRARRAVVVVPTQHLKVQWAHAAERFNLHLDPAWAAGFGTLPSDVHGVVVTYQQVAANPGAMRSLVRGAMVVLDEIHHAGESRAWGDGVRFAFEQATQRLCLSGTPFRSDQSVIPFVTYDADLARPDYEYGYGQALGDRGVVRPVYFPRIGGEMEWTAPDGESYSATFDDRLTRELASQRLRTALAIEGDWLPAVLSKAHAQLMHLRAGDPTAAGLVIAIDQEHARGIAEIMHDRLGVTATVATSDDAGASRKISAFAESRAPWIVAVRMVSEGVDIPRLRVGVFASNTVTELFFRQAVGRLVRWEAGKRRQPAYMFIPDDLRLRTFALAIAEQRRHTLRKRDDADDRRNEPQPAAEETGLEPEQLSLFAAISAVPLDEHGRPLEETHPYLPDNDTEMGDEPLPAEAPVVEPLSLAPVPLPDPDPEPAAPPASGFARRRSLREENGALVRELVHLLGQSHAEVNAALNKKAGIKRIGEATIAQLEQRRELARSWIRRR